MFLIQLFIFSVVYNFSIAVKLYRICYLIITRSSDEMEIDFPQQEISLFSNGVKIQL